MAKIALDLIKLPTWNSRVTEADHKSESAAIEDLAASFKREGQLDPIEVEDNGDGSYLLVFGRRRRAAAIRAGWTEIEATVKPLTNDNERMIRDLIQNVKRKNLTSFEEARACAEMRTKGLKNNEIAGILGFSMQKVSNLGNRYEKLPVPILQEWRAQNPVATDEFLAEISSDKEFPTPEKKMQRWDERVAEIAEAGKVPGKRGKGKDKDKEPAGTAGYPVSQKRLSHVIDALGSKKLTPELSDETRNWARALVAFVIQGRETPPAGIPGLPVKASKEKKAV